MAEKEDVQQDKTGGLGALLGNSGKDKPKTQKTSKTAKSKAFTITIQPETIKLFNQIQWLKEYAIDFQRATRDTVLMAALESYAKEIDFEGLMHKFKGKVPDSISPKQGRPANS